MEVPNYRPIYGPVTNGPLGSGLLGTAAATLARLDPHNLSSISHTYQGITDASTSENVSNYLQTIETLKEENEALKNKLDLLEIQFKFLLNKFSELEKFMERVEND